jgi:ubiquinone/menaquinone biosynthesis C-methylase UbiE
MLKLYGKMPVRSYETEEGVKLGTWCETQKRKKKKGKLTPERVKLLEELPFWVWDCRIKKDMTMPEIYPTKETKEEKRKLIESELSKLHKKYKTMNSENLHKEFNENPKEWEEYHKISKQNEESFPEEEIPRNKVITSLKNLPGSKAKVVADLGCGYAEVNEYFEADKRFTFHNLDHVSVNENVVSKDIKNTGLDDFSIDIVILSLAMWGSNCHEYIKEVYRILDIGGTLFISEPYKRWNKDLDEHGHPINKLVKLLEECNLTIKKNEERKFMFIECMKLA